MSLRAAAWIRVALCAALLACEPRATTERAPDTTEPSPNASILPAPLASDIERRPSPSRDAALPEGSSAASGTPRPLHDGVELPADAPPRETSGLRLRARFSWLDLPPFPRLPEANVEAAERLRRELALGLVLEASPAGRLRVVLDSDAFVLPRGAELRARLDFLGHVLLYRDRYTLLPAGTLRAVLTERRADAAPLLEPRVTTGEGGRLLGLPTERAELSTALGRLVLEQAVLPSAGEGGVLVCRLLGELVTANPTNTVCRRGRLPVRAELFSAGGGHLLFEVMRLEREQPLAEEDLSTTPPRAELVRKELPPGGSPLVLAPGRLPELRLRAAPRSEKPDPSAPRQGLLVQNRTETFRYVLLDGVVLARVPPRAEVHVDGLLPGKYGLVTLDFLGDEPTPLRILELPARVALGEDAAGSE
ncbi:MAG TPA: hypothetical protein VKY73_13425 [Polyangiaceae bacterium]|nr:hypothetical protein [Polyangiaceae bacterium]